MLSKKKLMTNETCNLRHTRRDAFLKSLGLESATLEAMQADASFRRYYRVHGAGKPMLLMEDPPDRQVELSPVKVEEFIAIGGHLRNMGLHAPEVYHRNVAHGLLLIEDFGDDTYTRLFAQGKDPKALYTLAIDALIALHNHPRCSAIDLGNHNADVLVEGAMLLLDWYYPALTGKQPTVAMKESFADVWRGLFQKFPSDQKALVLRDYHVDNLMLVPGEGVWACGLLDFQDALIGQCSYDVMSLLEDARRDVAEDLREFLYGHYLKGRQGAIDAQAFQHAFRILAAQRHARVLGVFVRLSVRDGKDRYLQFIPHVHKLFMRALSDPALAALKAWFDKNGFDISRPLKA